MLIGGLVACGGYLWLVRPGAERAALAEEGDGSLRTVVVDAEGLFLLYDAAAPEGQAGSPAGYVAYWRDFFDETLYVFDRLLFTPAHVGRAVHALRRDLEVQAEALGVIHPGVGEAMGQAGAAHGPDGQGAAGAGSAGPAGWGSWTPAGEATIAAVMGFDPQDLGLGDTIITFSGHELEACDPLFCTESVGPGPGRGRGKGTLPFQARPPKPPPGLSVDDHIVIIIQSACCGSGGGGGPGPDEDDDDDPCEGSTDPCCGSSDPCCDDPCCGDPCCGEPDPDDLDCDGIPNGEDDDIDGDGIPNGEDDDVDGDGTPNGEDDDIDGDGTPNGEDDDIDGDGTPNGEDDDIDGDGLPNGGDDDIDGDGVGNDYDPDADGDGLPNDSDDDSDGDGSNDDEDPTPCGCEGICCSDPESNPCCGCTADCDACTDSFCSMSAGFPQCFEVRAVDLWFALSEDDEEDPGGFLCVNDDDDNDNGIPDKNETEQTDGEDDLKWVIVSADQQRTGTVTLSTPSGGDHIRVWKNHRRSDPVALPKSWTICPCDDSPCPCPDVHEFPMTLYIEGVTPSTSARDVELRLRFTGDGGPCEDKIKLTVLQVNLGVSGLAESVEENPPGQRLGTNNDFDEGKTDAAQNPVPDFADVSPVTADGSGIALTGLLPCTALVLPQSGGALADSVITLSKTGGTGSVRVLGVRPTATAPFDDDWVPVPLGTNLRDDFYLSTGPYNSFECWIEGISPGPVELTLRFRKGGAVCEDRVLVNVVQYAIVEVMYKTFIQCEVAGPTPPDPWLYDFFRGDNRTFGYSFGPTQCRTYQRGLFTVNPAKPDGSTGREIVQVMGITQGFDDEPDGSDVCLMGSPCAPGLTPTCGGQCSYTFLQGATPECTMSTSPSEAAVLLPITTPRVGDSHLNVTVVNRGKDQCETLVPAIDVDLVLEFRQVYDGNTGMLGPLEFRATGSYDGYPWHELYLNGTIVFLHDPCVTGEGPNSMFGGGEHNFDGSGEFPNVDPSQTGITLSIWQLVPGQP